jgi:hypothetical protein
MSKKAKLYLLIVINLIAWGYVGYRIYAAFKGDDDISFENTNTTIQKIDEVKKDDSIVLSLNYSDPFLKGGSFAKEHKQTISSTKNTTSAPTVKQSVKTPSVVSSPSLDIKYIGLVKNNDKGTQTAMIAINGKSYFVNQKDVIEGLSFIEITKDYIKIKKGKEIIFVSK